MSFSPTFRAALLSIVVGGVSFTGGISLGNRNQDDSRVVANAFLAIHSALNTGQEIPKETWNAALASSLRIVGMPPAQSDIRFQVKPPESKPAPEAPASPSKPAPEAPASPSKPSK